MGTSFWRRVPLKERVSFLYIEQGLLSVKDGSLVLESSETQVVTIPQAGVGCLLLGPGTSVTHAAVAHVADAGSMIIWTGADSARVYAAGDLPPDRLERVIHQAHLVSNDPSRIEVAKRMFRYRFATEFEEASNLDQLRALEANLVKLQYKSLSDRFKISWPGRITEGVAWGDLDPLNKAISVGNSCLYGIVEAAVLAAGYSPALGFVHSGAARSFIYDIADMLKFSTVVPLAFEIVATGKGELPNLERTVRHGCRDYFRQTRLIDKIIPLIDKTLEHDEGCGE